MSRRRIDGIVVSAVRGERRADHRRELTHDRRHRPPPSRTLRAGYQRRRRGLFIERVVLLPSTQPLAHGGELELAM